MANFCTNSFTFPPPSAASQGIAPFNSVTMATTMHQHLVHFTPPSVSNNTVLRAGPHEQHGAATWTQSGGHFISSQTSPCISVAPSSGWQHTVPTTMPWQDSGGRTHNGRHICVARPPLGSSTSSGTLNLAFSQPSTNSIETVGQRRCKRKGFSENFRNGPKEKVFINEEKMAAHMEQLQLDNNNLNWHPDLEQEAWYCQLSAAHSKVGSLKEIEDRLEEDEEDGVIESCSDSSDSNDSVLPKLEVSNLLKVGMKTKQILPQLILDEMNKSCMQVVLWKPPERFVPSIIKDVTSINGTSLHSKDTSLLDIMKPDDISDVVREPPRSPRTPIPDLLLEAAAMNNNNNAQTSNNHEPDVWQIMTSTPLPYTAADFTFEDEMEL